MHECGHLAALALFRVPVLGLRLGAMGAVIHAPGAKRLSYGRELAVTLAGPAVNLLAAPLFAALGGEWWYLFAGAHVVLGSYNLLPIPPLDGARALWLLTAWRFCPDTADAVSAAVGLLCAVTLTALGAYLTLRCGAGLFLVGALGLLFGALRPLFRRFF